MVLESPAQQDPLDGTSNSVHQCMRSHTLSAAACHESTGVSLAQCDGQQHHIAGASAACPANDMNLEEWGAVGGTEEASLSGSLNGGMAKWWSCTSNGLFFFGSAVYVYLAAWDLRYYRAEYDNSSSYNTNTPSLTPSPSPLSVDNNDASSYGWDLYMWLCALASLTFLMNAFVDLAWALRDMKSHTSEGGERYGNPQTGIAIAAAFGMGAALELLAVFLWDDDNPGPEYAAYMAAAHIYLVSAVLTLKARTPSLSSTLVVLEAGDVLFFVGSMIDTVLSYLNDPDITTVNFLVLGRWNLTSSLLWLVDAVLYISSDLVQYAYHARTTSVVGGWQMGINMYTEIELVDQSAEGEKVECCNAVRNLVDKDQGVLPVG